MLRLPWLLPLLLPPLTGCSQPRNPEPLRVTFLDVGQGDSAVVESPTGRVVVIDGGGHPGTDERDGSDPGSRVVVPFLRSRGINTVDMILPTHADDDHAQGLIAVVDSLTVRAALDGGFGGASGPYRRLLHRLHTRRIPVYTARRGQRIDLGGGARLEIAHPSPPHYLKGTRSETNSNSVVVRLVYGKARLLLTGDADDDAEADLLRARMPLDADILKVGHHGSRFSTTDAFLSAVHPSAAIISVGRENNFGHPSPEVLSRLAAHHIRVFRTDYNGAITVETNGSRFRIVPTLQVKERGSLSSEPRSP